MRKLIVSKVLSFIAGVVDIYYDEALNTNICANFRKNLKQLQQFIQGHGRKLFLKITIAENLFSGLFIGAQV